MLKSCFTGKISGFPTYFVRAGFTSVDTLFVVGNNGFYWTSTVEGINGATYMAVTGSGVYPSTNSARSYGLSIRCVAR